MVPIVFAVTSVLGPVLGGVITDALSWHWIFYVNLPVGIVAFYIIARAMRKPARTHAHKIDYLGSALLTGAVTAALLVLDRRALLGVDWGLLVTFAAFFTFSGNMARIEPVRELFRKLLTHGAMPVAALTSQVISNVPAAILLSQFTDDYPALLVGVNIGGAGTLVASLASLITFREYTKHVKGQTGRDRKSVV